MRPKLERNFLLTVLVTLGAGVAMASGESPEQTTMAAKEVTAWSGVVRQVPEVFRALKTDEAIPLLVVVCNMIMALLKTSWFQRKLTAFSKSGNELTDAGKTFLALGVGVTITWLFSPASTEIRTIGKGLMLGFAAIGMYHAWKHSLRDIVFKKRVPETVALEAESDQEPSEDPELAPPK